MELLVVIGLMGILLVIAIPGMDIIQTSRLNGAARTVWRDIHLARITAVKENMEIQVVFSGKGIILKGFWTSRIMKFFLPEISLMSSEMIQ
jgi:Tfp pilus assembly protein FimT